MAPSRLAKAPLLSDVEVTQSEKIQEDTSQVAWSTAAAQPTSPVYHRHTGSTEIHAGKSHVRGRLSSSYGRLISPTSPTPSGGWSTSAYAPLLVESEDDEKEETGAAEEDLHSEVADNQVKKSFFSTEYKTAFSHFLVSF